MTRDTFLKELPCTVTREEMLDKGQLLSRQITIVGTIQAAKKQSASEFKAREEAAQAEVNATANVIATGIEYRNVECRLMPDHTRGVMDTLRTDTWELIDTRRMRDDERQRAIEFEADETAETTEETASVPIEEATATEEAPAEEASTDTEPVPSESGLTLPEGSEIAAIYKPILKYAKGRE